MTELNSTPLSPIELESKQQELSEQFADKLLDSAKTSQSKTYTYTINGKPKTVKRNYEIKDTTSFRTKAVREQVKKYVDEHKQSLSEILPKHRASTLIKNLQTDMNIHISYNSAIKLLTEAELK